ncbi:MAG TPA: mechanosensitive ion channel family protein [Candidatus Copromorpha excrementigallinarum]|uniref:Mechanosensitive ion channel family protein n=1 Tax=Candidatus Allocopromorpha excrementigallinarum TaxID=2840742 RepID=A0A9D1L4W7_9FIRM|nr:mechanosensitive ion channel family protein [Candidatus Copromorpha excrementigallinarum]
MENIERAETFVERLISSERLTEIGLLALRLAFVVAVGLAFIKVVLVITRKALGKSSLDPVIYTFVLNAIKVITIIILVTVCLGMLGIQMSTIIAVIGAAGAAIALALKDSLANIAGGVMIILTQPFKKEDLIDVESSSSGSISGKVEDIDLFLTTLKTYDNKTITIPNGIINTSVLVNHSKEDNRRVDCTFGIGYDSDIGEAKRILKKVCYDNPLIFREPEPLIGVANHGESSVEIDLKAWCRTDDYWDVKYYLEEEVKLAFDENHITIPYNQVEVHIKKERDNASD